MGTAHQLHVVHPRGVPLPAPAPLVIRLPVFSPVSSLSLGTLPPAVAEGKSAETERTPARCREKGCIFPASHGADGKCVHHYREQREPAMYLSSQPTRAVLEHGKFFQPAEELVFGSREADRRRLEAERRAFFEA